MVREESATVSFFVVLGTVRIDATESVPRIDEEIPVAVSEGSFLVACDDEAAIVESATISEDEVRKACLVLPKDEETGSISVPFVVSGIAAIVVSATTFEDEVREAYL